jgi:hypothetical protein
MQAIIYRRAGAEGHAAPARTPKEPLKLLYGLLILLDKEQIVAQCCPAKENGKLGIYIEKSTGYHC